MTSVVTNVLGRLFWWMFVHSHLGYVPRRIVGGLAWMFSFSRYCLTFSKWLYQLTHLLTEYEFSSFSTSFPVLTIVSLFHGRLSCGCVVVLICTSLMANGDEIFYMLIAIWVSSFVWCLMKSFADFSAEWSAFSLPICRSFLICSEFESFISHVHCKYLFSLSWLDFSFF